VLVDGVRINDPSSTTGYAILGDVLATASTASKCYAGRIDALRHDAIGGVVNILTSAAATSRSPCICGRKRFVRHLSFQMWRQTAPAAPWNNGGRDYYGTNGISAADSKNGNSEPDGYHHLGATRKPALAVR